MAADSRARQDLSVSRLPQRALLLRRAIALSALSVGWSGVVGIAAVLTATSSGSVSVLGFGVDAVIDAAASVALIWRFRVERTEPSRAVAVEHQAERAVGVVLMVAAVVVTAGAVRSLFAQSQVEASVAAIAILVASLVVLPPLAAAKRAVARDLASSALRADSFLTGAGAVLAGISLIGVVAAASIGLWWADALGALVIAGAMALEGSRSATSLAEEQPSPTVDDAVQRSDDNVRGE